MAEPITIARPYARAAFRSANGAGLLSGWGEFLARAAAIVHDPQVVPLLDNPRVQAAELIDFVLEVASASMPVGQSGTAGGGSAAIPPVLPLRNFLTLLAHNRRLPLLPQIAAQFEALRADAEHFANVDVVSARPLTPEQSQRLRSALERRLGRTVRLHARADPALIGGAVVHYGDYVIDGSLRRRVERLASEVSGA